MAITGYRIIRAPIDAIGVQVTQSIGDGFTPLGSAFSLNPRYLDVHQALVQGAIDDGEIEEYEVIRAEIDSIERQVESAIDDGWQPYGAPTIAHPHINEVYQTLVTISAEE